MPSGSPFQAQERAQSGRLQQLERRAVLACEDPTCPALSRNLCHQLISHVEVGGLPLALHLGQHPQAEVPKSLARPAATLRCA